MPPACRALFRERSEMNHHDGPQAHDVLHSFLNQIIDSAVRDWGRLSPQAAKLGIETTPRFQASPDISQVWWQSLWSNKSKIEWPTSREHELTRFYQAWQSWTHRAQPAADAAFRLCFRLEPPEFDSDSGRVVSPDWVLRYFLQAHDDPSLLVPAHEVWRERGSTLSYLNHRFDQPQEKLLAGLGMAARLCPAIERSLQIAMPRVGDADGSRSLQLSARDGAPAGGRGPWRAWCRPGGTSPTRACACASRCAPSPSRARASWACMPWSLTTGSWRWATSR